MTEDPRFGMKERIIIRRLVANQARVEAQEAEGEKVGQIDYEKKTKEHPESLGHRNQETPGKTFIRLMNETVRCRIITEAGWGDYPLIAVERAQEGLMTVDQEFNLAFKKGDDFDGLRREVFNAAVDMKLGKHYRDQMRGGELG